MFSILGGEASATLLWALGGTVEDPLSLVLTEWGRGKYRVAPMMPKPFGQLSQILALKFHYGVAVAAHSVTE